MENDVSILDLPIIINYEVQIINYCDQHTNLSAAAAFFVQLSSTSTFFVFCRYYRLIHDIHSVFSLRRLFFTAINLITIFNDNQPNNYGFPSRHEYKQEAIIMQYI